MQKKGRYRAIRNIPVGWVLQAIHSTDRSERYFRIIIELFTLLVIYSILEDIQDSNNYKSTFISAVLINHTITWFITGNFWVYMLDSFLWVKNPGIIRIIEFIQKVKLLFVATKSVDAILIYGSMCRGQLHIRSDLDLRVLKTPGLLNGFVALSVGYLIRAYSFFIRMPVDLEVVDSMEFIRKQMRKDERPIDVYIRAGINISEIGISFTEVEENPSIVLRDENN